MAAPATPSFRLNWLKIWYKDLGKIQQASTPASPLFSRIGFEKTGGEVVSQPFELNLGRAEAGTYSAVRTVAQGESANAAKYRWRVPYGEYFGSIEVTHRDIALSRQDRDAAARALQHEADGVFKRRASNIMRLFLGPVGNSLGQATLAAGVLTFADRANTRWAYRGDLLSFSAGSGTGSDTVVGQPGYVMKVENEVTGGNTGKISVSATDGGAIGNPAGVADGTYFVFRYGEFNSSNTNGIITPMDAYNPATPALGASDLHDVRRADHTLLSGLRVPDIKMAGRTTGSKIKIFIAHAMQFANISDSDIDTIVLNPLDWADAEEEYSSTVSREVSDTTEDGFSRMVVNTPNGRVMLLADPHQPQGLMRLLSSSQIKFHTPHGSLAEWADEEGFAMRRKEDALVYEKVAVTYVAAVITNPGAHGRQSLTV
jgi:hypothetical protein